MAPEIFRQQKYTETGDVFAYGTMLWEAMVVDIPFANLDAQDIREKVLHGQMMPIPASTSSQVRDVIQTCWTMDRNARPGMTEILTLLRACPADRDSGAAASRSRRPRTAGDAGRRQMGDSSCDILDGAMGTRVAPPATRNAAFGAFR